MVRFKPTTNYIQFFFWIYMYFLCCFWNNILIWIIKVPYFCVLTNPLYYIPIKFRICFSFTFFFARLLSAKENKEHIAIVCISSCQTLFHYVPFFIFTQNPKSIYRRRYKKQSDDYTYVFCSSSIFYGSFAVISR